ncbi:MAG: hypothetical protein AAF593_05900 [Planctomycetota bacterium]
MIFKKADSIAKNHPFLYATFLVLASVAIIFLNFLFSGQNSNTYIALGLGLACVIAAIFASALVSAQVSVEKFERDIDEAITNIRNSPSYSWLKNIDQIHRLESSSDVEEIWILSPDLSNDVGKGQAVETVKKNIETNDVRYTYFIPMTARLTWAVGELRQIFASKPDNLSIYVIDKIEFCKIGITHLMIINPNSHSKSLYLELPISSRNFWIRAENEFTGRMLERIDNIKKKPLVK